MSLAISGFRPEIKNGTENVTRHFEFSSRNRKRDRKCRSLFRVFVSKLKTGQKMSLAISGFRLEIKNGTENVTRHFEFSSRNRKRDRKCRSVKWYSKNRHSAPSFILFFMVILLRLCYNTFNSVCQNRHT